MAVTKLIQVTNISPAISDEQMLTLFGFVGKIEAMCMYPSLQDLESAPNTPKICYIKFFDATCVGVSQYLTNTVFNDRALVVTPVEDGQIPDEEKAKQMAAQVGQPPVVNKPPDKPKSEIVNLLKGTPPNQVIVSHDPRLEELGLPKYPPLPASFEGPVIEEIRRTVLIIDINKKVTSEELIECFEKAGDIKYMKFCSRSDDIRYALIEFTEQAHVIEALQMNGLNLKGKVMKVYHSTQAITKPETKSNEVAQREVVEALTRVKEAESLISAVIDPLLSLSKSKKGRKGRSKSPRKSRRSRSRRPSHSRSHSHRRRASPRSRRSRSRSPQRKLKSKSPRRHRKSRSKSPRVRRKTPPRSPRTKKKSRSKSPCTKRKSRSKSPSRPKRKSRSKSPARAKKRSRSKSPLKAKRKSRSRSKSPSKSKRKSRSRSKSPSKLTRQSRSRSKSPSKSKRKSRSWSKSPSKPTRQSRSRSKSPSKSKRKLRSRSKSPSKSKRKSRSRSKSPLKSKRKSRSRSPRSKRSRSRSPRSKYRPSPKSKTPFKSSLNRDKARNLDKSPEKRSNNRKNQGKSSTKRDKKDGGSRSKRSEKDQRKSKHKDLENHKSSKENGNCSSHKDRASTDLSCSKIGHVVKENGAVEHCNTGLEIQEAIISEETSSFNQTEKYNKTLESSEVSGRLNVCTSEEKVSVLKGPNIFFKCEGLDGKENHNVFFTDLPCDSSAVDCSPKQRVEYYNENDYPDETSEMTRSQSHSPSDSLSGHCLPNLADCDTRSCSPVEPS